MTVGLVRVTIDAPQRRVDMALPERSPVAEILPGLLRHAGEELADDGVADGGWVLRRTDGAALDGGRTLGAHRVRDGEVLHLVPRRMHWPELEYDDLVDAIASGAGRTGRLWAPGHTRVAGLLASVVAVLLGFVAVLRSGPSWGLAGLVALAAATVLLVVATMLARVLGDSGAGVVFAGLSLPLAFAGGAMIFGGGLSLPEFGAAQALGGCAALLPAAVLGFLGVVDRMAVFAAAVTAGLLGAVTAWLATVASIGSAGAAAIVAGAVLIGSPLLTPLSLRLGRVPLPVLPRTAADLVRDDPQPPRSAVNAAVLRADGLLTGMLAGCAIVTVCCEVLLVRADGTSAIVLLFVLGLGLCVRARLYPAVRHRAALLGAGAACGACLAAGPLMADPWSLLRVAFPVLMCVAAALALAGIVHSRRAPSAYLGRYAELFEVLLVLACVPVVCAVLGLFGFVRGLGG